MIIKDFWSFYNMVDKWMDEEFISIGKCFNNNFLS